jgi:hypothetical protein
MAVAHLVNFHDFFYGKHWFITGLKNMYLLCIRALFGEAVNCALQEIKQTPSLLNSQKTSQHILLVASQSQIQAL